MKKGVLLVATALAMMAMMQIVCVSSGDSEETRNIEVVHVQHSEIWSKGNLDLIGDIYAQDFIGHFPTGTVHGRAGLLARVRAIVWPSQTGPRKLTIRLPKAIGS